MNQMIGNQFRSKREKCVEKQNRQSSSGDKIVINGFFRFDVHVVHSPFCLESLNNGNLVSDVNVWLITKNVLSIANKSSINELANSFKLLHTSTISSRCLRTHPTHSFRSSSINSFKWFTECEKFFMWTSLKTIFPLFPSGNNRKQRWPDVAHYRTIENSEKIEIFVSR